MSDRVQSFMTMEASVFSYMGSKSASGAYQAIIASMPPHDTYIETHLGSGAVMMRKPPCSLSIGIDIDKVITDRFLNNGRFEVWNCDAAAAIDSFDYAGSGRVLIYADPPYVHSTRTGNKRYRFEYSDADHIRLLDSLKKAVALGAAVMVSGYPSELYAAMLPAWRSLEFQCMTRGGVRTEKLWMSFPPGGMHWHIYAGHSFTDRQRIKRKAARWAKNYAGLSEGEKLAVLSALLGTT